MKYLLAVFFVISSLGELSAQTFTRNLPTKQTQDALTTKNFPDMDAVILLNERSYVVQAVTRYIGSFSLRLPYTAVSNVLIVKLFDDAGVKEYADQEFYFDAFSVTGDDPRYYARARVLKPDGTVQVTPPEDIQKVVFLKSSDGEPLIYKMIVKIPNVSRGDIIQYESFHETSSFSMHMAENFGGLFFYNTGDFTLYSNLYVSVPSNYSTKFYNFPENLVGEPEVIKDNHSSGTETTYFWSVKNLRGIPDEAYSFPFAEASVLTAVVGGASEKDISWNKLADDFKDKYVSGSGSSADELSDLGMTDRPSGSVTSFPTIDTLYMKLRKYFVLSDNQDLFPDSKGLSDDFDARKADASDMALIMYRLLKHWGVESYPVWIRDDRRGLFEEKVPILNWFDRMGVLAKINGKNMLYDFDRSIPAQYETPWFMHNTTVMVLGDDSCYAWRVSNAEPEAAGLSYEKHDMTLSDDGSLHDSMFLIYRGRPAQELRNRYYESDSESVADDYKSNLGNTLLSSVTSIGVNNFLNDRQFAVSASGISSANVQTIDSLLVITPNDYLLSKFRNRLFSATRHNDVDLDVPLSFRVEFMIAVPPGYTYADSLTDLTISGPAYSSATATVQLFGNNINVTTSVQLPSAFIPLSSYRDFMTFLDKSVSLVRRNIVLKKSK